MKKCTTCLQTKDFSCFGVYRHKLGALRAQCNPCRVLDSQRYARDNKDKVRAAAKRRRETSKPERKDQQLKHKFGITSGRYADMWASQGGVCAICLRPEVVLRRGNLKSLAVDHNKNTGKVRALLCQKCNQALGLVKEEPATLTRMIQYLSAHK